MHVRRRGHLGRSIHQDYVDGRIRRGQAVTQLSAVYGPRQYHRGSICAMHTDRADTHAFSAIYQLDQRGMDEPWGAD